MVDKGWLIAYPNFQFLEPANAEEALDKCRQVLAVSAEVRDPQLLPEYDSRNRIGRGLAQRLVKQWGLDSLKDQARPYRDKPEDEWPLPVIGEADGDRILKLVQTYDEANPPTLLWRKEDGSLLWSLDPTTGRPSTLKGGQM